MDRESTPNRTSLSDLLLTDVDRYQVSYLREIRGGGVSSGYVATGFWGGVYMQCLPLHGCSSCSFDFR